MSRSFDPPEPRDPVYCEACDEYDDACTCAEYYIEEKPDD